MSLGPEFYASQCAEFGGDVKTFADAIEASVRRGDLDEARTILARLEERAWRVVDAAKSALS